jgi:APA family basic amino acid/polyamine antiporter
VTDRLARTLDRRDAVVIGLASMIGAGVFSALGVAAAAGAVGILVGLALAAAVAWGNATSSAQLAALHPDAGGTYVYGRERLSPRWGHLAGWLFVVGKTASAAAMALTLGHHLAPRSTVAVAVTAVVLATAVDARGARRTVGALRAGLVVIAAALTTAVVAAALSVGTSPPTLATIGPLWTGPRATLGAAAVLFFAFAGFARIATLGEEVHDPATTIPAAIPRALAVTLAVYVVVAIAAVASLGAGGLLGRTEPLALIARTGLGAPGEAVVRVGAVVASAGVLVSLLAGIGRTVLAMARDGHLPRTLAHVDASSGVAARAQWAVGGAVVVAVLAGDLASTIAASSFGVLGYYAIANASALRLAPEERRWPRWQAVGGLVGCLVLAASLPVPTVVAGSVLAVAGLVAHEVTRARPAPGG